ncbi:hypothetical protein KEM52_004986 [Ascosphaera acerosa]|nr:hypothetical protein KEM52_004986 [Ascosphaera acerosa]
MDNTFPVGDGPPCLDPFPFDDLFDLAEQGAASAPPAAQPDPPPDNKPEDLPRPEGLGLARNEAEDAMFQTFLQMMDANNLPDLESMLGASSQPQAGPPSATVAGPKGPASAAQPVPTLATAPTPTTTTTSATLSEPTIAQVAARATGPAPASDGSRSLAQSQPPSVAPQDVQPLGHWAHCPSLRGGAGPHSSAVAPTVHAASFGGLPSQAQTVPRGSLNLSVSSELAHPGLSHASAQTIAAASTLPQHAVPPQAHPNVPRRVLPSQPQQVVRPQTARRNVATPATSQPQQTEISRPPVQAANSQVLQAQSVPQSQAPAAMTPQAPAQAVAETTPTLTVPAIYVQSATPTDASPVNRQPVDRQRLHPPPAQAPGAQRAQASFTPQQQQQLLLQHQQMQQLRQWHELQQMQRLQHMQQRQSMQSMQQRQQALQHQQMPQQVRQQVPPAPQVQRVVSQPPSAQAQAPHGVDLPRSATAGAATAAVDPPQTQQWQGTQAARAAHQGQQGNGTAQLNGQFQHAAPSSRPMQAGQAQRTSIPQNTAAEQLRSQSSAAVPPQITPLGPAIMGHLHVMQQQLELLLTKVNESVWTSQKALIAAQVVCWFLPMWLSSEQLDFFRERSSTLTIPPLLLSVAEEVIKARDNLSGNGQADVAASHNAFAAAADFQPNGEGKRKRPETESDASDEPARQRSTPPSTSSRHVTFADNTPMAPQAARVSDEASTSSSTSGSRMPSTAAPADQYMQALEQQQLAVQQYQQMEQQQALHIGPNGHPLPPGLIAGPGGVMRLPNATANGQPVNPSQFAAMQAQGHPQAHLLARSQPQFGRLPNGVPMNPSLRGFAPAQQLHPLIFTQARQHVLGRQRALQSSHQVPLNQAQLQAAVNAEYMRLQQMYAAHPQRLYELSQGMPRMVPAGMNMAMGGSGPANAASGPSTATSAAAMGVGPHNPNALPSNSQGPLADGAPATTGPSRAGSYQPGSQIRQPGQQPGSVGGQPSDQPSDMMPLEMQMRNDPRAAAARAQMMAQSQGHPMPTSAKFPMQAHLLQNAQMQGMNAAVPIYPGQQQFDVIARLHQYGAAVSSFTRSDDEKNIDYWFRFVEQFFSPSGDLRFGLKDAEAGSKKFEITSPLIARYYLTQFASGVERIQINFENAVSRLHQDLTQTVEAKATIIYWYRTGCLQTALTEVKAIFNPDNMIDLLEFNTQENQEFLHKDSLIEMNSGLPHGEADVLEVQSHDQSKLQSVVRLPKSLVRQFCVPTDVMSFLETAETLLAMTPLIQYSQDHPDLTPGQALHDIVSTFNKPQDGVSSHAFNADQLKQQQAMMLGSEAGALSQQDAMHALQHRMSMQQAGAVSMNPSFVTPMVNSMGGNVQNSPRPKGQASAMMAHEPAPGSVPMMHQRSQQMGHPLQLRTTGMSRSTSVGPGVIALGSPRVGGATGARSGNANSTAPVNHKKRRASAAITAEDNATSSSEPGAPRVKASPRVVGSKK